MRDLAVETRVVEIARGVPETRAVEAQNFKTKKKNFGDTEFLMLWFMVVLTFAQPFQIWRHGNFRDTECFNLNINITLMKSTYYHPSTVLFISLTVSDSLLHIKFHLIGTTLLYLYPELMMAPCQRHLLAR